VRLVNRQLRVIQTVSEPRAVHFVHVVNQSLLEVSSILKLDVDRVSDQSDHAFAAELAVVSQEHAQVREPDEIDLQYFFFFLFNQA